MFFLKRLFIKLFYGEHHFPKNPYNPHCWIIGNPKIGKNCWIGPFTIIDGSGGLEIGDGTAISCGVQIYTHTAVKRTISGGERGGIERLPVKIGSQVHIGPNATILMGVTIGDHAVVGAGAVVKEGTKIPSHSVAVGVPAKITGKDSRNIG